MGEPYSSSLKDRMTVVKNEKNELIPIRTDTSYRMCIGYRKLNDATSKNHFPLPFIDLMLECLLGHDHYCFLDGMSGYFRISIALEDQEITALNVPMVRLLIIECLSGFVMLLLLYKVA